MIARKAGNGGLNFASQGGMTVNKFAGDENSFALGKILLNLFVAGKDAAASC
jgi:hypothetical protein